jgi:hypothetical protein
VDGSVLFVGGLYQSHGLGSLAWVRIGPNLELLERRKAPIEGVEAATFDSRGALLTAGPWLAGFDGPPFKVQRYRGARLRLDRSFGDREGKRYFHLRRPAKLLGVAMQDDKLIVAGYRWSDPSGDQPLILIRLYARQDTAAPKIAVIGLPRRHCVRGSSSPLVRAHDESRVRTHARLDGHRLTTSNRHRFRIHLDTNQLASGRHVLTLRATDAAGNDSRARHTIRVCR